MLSNEEKKAIERIKDLISKSKVIKDIEINKHVAFKDIDTVLNLIEKQSKEIEELKAQRLKEINNTKYCVHKNKIKAKIEDILNSENSEAIEKLIEWQSLLEKE